MRAVTGGVKRSGNDVRSRTWAKAAEKEKSDLLHPLAVSCGEW